jgi:hypothetical protein
MRGAIPATTHHATVSTTTTAARRILASTNPGVSAKFSERHGTMVLRVGGAGWVVLFFVHFQKLFRDSGDFPPVGLDVGVFRPRSSLSDTYNITHKWTFVKGWQYDCE